MAGPYALGVWTVKGGRADEFVAAWSEFADWTAGHAGGAGWVKLLRDRENPERFVTVGPWDSLEALAAWRSLDGWTERIGRIQELLDRLQTATLDLIIERG